MKKNISISSLTIVLIACILLLISSNINWGKERWLGIVEADAKGYYAYLPAIFIYNDLNLGFFEEIEYDKYYNENYFYDYRANANGRVINKYFCGTALAELPFFLIAHKLTYWLGYENDGFSKPYPIAVNIAAIFYLTIGLMFLNRLLSKYKIRDTHRTWVLLAATFGTHLYCYTVIECGMSHVFSFCFITMFLYFIHQYFTSHKAKYLFHSSLVLGMITIIRPINIVIVFFIPFLAGSFEQLLTGLKEALKKKLSFLLAGVIYVSVVAIQFVIYKISTGSFFVDSYVEEGFNFLSPQIFNILFSYKKGLFVYTPMLFLSLFGGYFLWQFSRYKFLVWLIFFSLITYIFSSWWMWYYGGSFSARIYVEYISLFMILLALPLQKLKKVATKNLYIGIIILLTLLCQAQTYQYKYNQIHWSEMTKDKYWDVFLRLDKI